MNVAELLDIPASMLPEQEILSFEGRSFTYDELQDMVQRTAGVLNGLGVGQGDRVAVVDTNSVDLVVSLFAIVSLGAAFIPLSYRGRLEEWQHMLMGTRPSILLASPRYLEACQRVCADVAADITVIPLS